MRAWPGGKRATAAGYAPHSVDFTADHRVLLSAVGDPAIWAVAVMGDVLASGGRRIEHSLAIDAGTRAVEQLLDRGHLDPAGCGYSHTAPRQPAIASDNASAAIACLTAGALAARRDIHRDRGRRGPGPKSDCRARANMASQTISVCQNRGPLPSVTTAARPLFDCVIRTVGCLTISPSRTRA